MRLSQVAFLLIVVSWVTPSQAQQRTELHLFQYGRTNNELLRTAFFDFRDMLAEKLPRLSAELSGEVKIPAVSQLKLKSVTDQTGTLLRPETRVGSLEAERRYWTQTGALGILTGHLKEQHDIPYVYTRFFWGSLGGPYAQETIELVLPVEGKSFDNTSDSHSVAVLYALAQAIKHDCANAPEAIYLLSEAQKRAKALSHDLPELAAQLEPMVVAAIDDIRSKCSGR